MKQWFHNSSNDDCTKKFYQWWCSLCWWLQWPDIRAMMNFLLNLEIGQDEVFCRGENIILSTTCRLGGIIMVNRTFCQTVWNSAGLWLWLGRAFRIARSKKQSRHFFVKFSPFTKFRVHSTSYNVMSVCLLNPTAFHVFSNFGVSVFTLTKHTFSWGMTTAYIFMAQ